MQLDDCLRNLAEELGADYFGVADLSLARDFIISQGGLEVGGYTKAVSIGIALLNPIVDQLPNRAQKAMAIEYRHHAYDVVNERLDSLPQDLEAPFKRRATGLSRFLPPNVLTTSGSALSSPTSWLLIWLA